MHRLKNCSNCRRDETFHFDALTCYFFNCLYSLTNSTQDNISPTPHSLNSFPSYESPLCPKCTVSFLIIIFTYIYTYSYTTWWPHLVFIICTHAFVWSLVIGKPISGLSIDEINSPILRSHWECKTLHLGVGQGCHNENYRCHDLCFIKDSHNNNIC